MNGTDPELEVVVTCGDCLAVLPTIPAGRFDVVVTSPPYNPVSGGDFHTYVRGHRVSYGGYDGYADALPEAEYQDQQVALLCELYRVTTRDAVAFYVHTNRIRHGACISPLEWIRRTPWQLKQEVVYLNNRGCSNPQRVRCFPNHEKVFVLVKAPRDLDNVDNWTDVWQIRTRDRRAVGHPATFPHELARRCILLGSRPGDRVLDPYCGTGTTLEVAKALGRHARGIEISPAYCEVARANLARVRPAPAPTTQRSLEAWLAG